MKKNFIKKVLPLLLSIVMAACAIPAKAFAVDNGTFTISQAEGGTQADVTLNGEARTIYCMQKDYLWPVAVNGSGYANDATHYREATADEMLLDADQLAIVQRVLYAGYPYDSVGALAPVYKTIGIYSSEYAAWIAQQVTQHVIWSFMSQWGIEGNPKGFADEPIEDGFYKEAYYALMDYVNSDTALPDTPHNFTPELNGSAVFVKTDDGIVTGALSISNPEGYVVAYDVELPAGVSAIDEDGNAVSGTIYGGETFYLTARNEASADGTVSISAVVKVPTDVKQYMTKDTGKDGKVDGDSPFQTMLSVGVDVHDLSAAAALILAEEKEEPAVEPGESVNEDPADNDPEKQDLENQDPEGQELEQEDSENQNPEDQVSVTLDPEEQETVEERSGEQPIAEQPTVIKSKETKEKENPAPEAVVEENPEETADEEPVEEIEEDEVPLAEAPTAEEAAEEIVEEELEEMPEDEVPLADVPATGDDGNTSLWLALLLVSAAALIAAVFGGRKRSRNN